MPVSSISRATPRSNWSPKSSIALNLEVSLWRCSTVSSIQRYRNTVRHHLDRWKTERSIGGSRRYNYSSKDWSPRSRTESIRSKGGSRWYKYSKQQGLEYKQGLEYSVQDREHTVRLKS
uniref:Uncharacterized protein n=1 Tax=Timema poppense TaxID=170557 RepID=A0A7R9DXC4_TIMPO|nr:unnamed protein product [Timema poppensis]